MRYADALLRGSDKERVGCRCYIGKENRYRQLGDRAVEIAIFICQCEERGALLMGILRRECDACHSPIIIDDTTSDTVLCRERDKR